jgi:hypothetical protein
MNSWSTNMLQTPWKNPRFELPTVANTVEMAASSSKMLQKQGNRTEQEIQ